MNQSEQIDDLKRNGWRLYQVYPRWKIFSRKTKDIHLQFNPMGLEFITVFRNGRTAKGHINP